MTFAYRTASALFFVLVTFMLFVTLAAAQEQLLKRVLLSLCRIDETDFRIKPTDIELRLLSI